MHKIKKICKISAIVLSLVLFCFLGGKYFLPEYLELKEQKVKEAETDKLIIVEEQKKKVLLNEEKNFNENPFFTERVARDKMGYAKEGETIYRFREEEK